MLRGFRQSVRTQSGCDCQLDAAYTRYVTRGPSFSRQAVSKGTGEDNVDIWSSIIHNWTRFAVTSQAGPHRCKNRKGKH